MTDRWREWWQSAREPHEVHIPCACPDIEACRMERYISDVRILTAELDEMKATRTSAKELPNK